LDTKDVLDLLGPVFALLVLSFGFLQIYPKFFESVADRRGYGAELERRTLRTALLILKLEITSVAGAAVLILLYPIADVLQESCGSLLWIDELLLMLVLLLLLAAVSLIVWGTWKIGFDSLRELFETLKSIYPMVSSQDPVTIIGFTVQDSAFSGSPAR
jgi:hypothetical protein